MPGIKWATDEEKAFLTTKVGDFAAIYSGGKSRVKNPAKAAFLNETYDEFDSLYPGRISSMDLPRINTGGSEVERRDVMKEVSMNIRIMI